MVSWMMRGTTQAEAHLGERQREAHDSEPLVVAEQLGMRQKVFICG